MIKKFLWFIDTIYMGLNSEYFSIQRNNVKDILETLSQIKWEIDDWTTHFCFFAPYRYYILRSVQENIFLFKLAVRLPDERSF